MRKIWSSANTSCSLAFSDSALARSVPNGFSMMMRERSTRPASASSRTADKAALGRHAEIMQAAAFPADVALGLFDRRLEGAGAGAERHIVEDLRKGGPFGLLRLAVGRAVERAARDVAEAVGVDGRRATRR